MKRKVVLINGESFIGKRSFWMHFQEGWNQTTFKVLESETLRVGSVVSVVGSSILYLEKVK